MENVNSPTATYEQKPQFKPNSFTAFFATALTKSSQKLFAACKKL